MLTGFGCCCGELDFCSEECRKSRHFAFDELACEFDGGFLWPYTSGDCSISSTTRFEHPTAGYTEIFTGESHAFTGDAADIASGINLVRRHATPESGVFSGKGYGSALATNTAVNQVCQWLWNDPHIESVVYHDAISDFFAANCDFPAELDFVASYVPQNPVASSSPWGRVTVTEADPRIGTCFDPAHCSTSLVWKWSVVTSWQSVCVYLAGGYAPNTQSIGIGTPAERVVYYAEKAYATSQHYWVAVVESNLYIISRYDSQRTYDAGGCFIYPSSKVIGAGSGLSSTNTVACSPGGFDNSTPGGGWIGYPGTTGRVEYAKLVDCSTDFEKDDLGNHSGIVLPFNKSLKETNLTNKLATELGHPDSITLRFSNVA